MNRRTEVHSIRPTLEALEGRDLPSFLLSGTVTAALVQPLNAMVQDLQSAKGDLLNQVNTTLLPNNTTFPPGNAGQTFARAVGDFQRMLNDQHAIIATSNADLQFIKLAASAELANGDPIDFLVLNFGQLLGLNVQSQFTTPVTTANNAVNDTTVQSDVAISWSYTVPISGQSFTLGPINQQINNPTF